VDGSAEDFVALGITNQRETAVVWDKKTGKPIYNAIVWQDTRTSHAINPDDKWLDRTGILANSYPAGPKIAWILDNVDGARERAGNGELLAGTIDTWLLWNLTGGARGDQGKKALHLTDVTKASRTLLMDIRTCSGMRSCAKKSACRYRFCRRFVLALAASAMCVQRVLWQKSRLLVFSATSKLHSLARPPLKRVKLRTPT